MLNQTFQLNDKFALIGKTKSGKSYLGKIIQRAYPRKIIIDTAYEYTPDLGHIIYGFEAFSNALIQVQDLDEYSLIFRFNREDTNRDQIFSEICRLVSYLGDTLFVIEEVHIHSNPHSLNPWLLQIATMGSHLGVALLLTTQRPSLIHKTLLTQCDHVFIGPLIDMNDLRYVREFCGVYADQVPTQPPRNFIYWNHTKISLLKTDGLK